MKSRCFTFLVLLPLVAVFVPLSARADWKVENNLDETFTIYVWPTNNSSNLQSRRIGPGKQASLSLGEDQHEIELLSEGNDLYILEPATLRNRTGVTKLKTILTPKKKKRNGRTVFQYMNQQGYDEGDSTRLEEVMWSAWQTEYQSPNGLVRTDLKFAGSAGSYNGGRGKLTDVTYENKNGQTAIKGKWIFDGKKDGQFQFTVDSKNPNRFSSNQNWSGKRLWEATGN